MPWASPYRCGTNYKPFPDQPLGSRLLEPELRAAADVVSRTVLAEVARSADSPLATAVWEKTKEEVGKKWLSGPYTYDELVLRFGQVLVASRFGVGTVGSCRVIDNMTASLVNQGFASPSKAKFSDLDDVVCVSKFWLEVIDDDGMVCVQFSDGTYWRDTLHPSITLEAARLLRTRVLDLRSAYKQQLVHALSMWCAAVGVSTTDIGKVERST